MFVHFSATRNYLLSALEGAPDLFAHHLKGLTEQEADFQPTPERFTIREVIAHMAEWDEIFLARMRRIRDESVPAFDDRDEGQLALDGDYAHSNSVEQMKIFSERRTMMTAFAASLSSEEWQRVCLHPRVGRLTLEGSVILVTLHDSYHLHQILEWRRAYENDGENG